MAIRDKTKIILLDHKEKIYDSVEVSPNAPKVKITSPADTEKLKGVHTVKWEGDDADGDPLTYSVLYSKDGGKTWAALATGISKTEYKLKTDQVKSAFQDLLQGLRFTSPIGMSANFAKAEKAAKQR